MDSEYVKSRSIRTSLSSLITTEEIPSKTNTEEYWTTFDLVSRQAHFCQELLVKESVNLFFQDLKRIEHVLLFYYFWLLELGDKYQKDSNKTINQIDELVSVRDTLEVVESLIDSRISESTDYAKDDPGAFDDAKDNSGEMVSDNVIIMPANEGDKFSSSLEDSFHMFDTFATSETSFQANTKRKSSKIVTKSAESSEDESEFYINDLNLVSRRGLALALLAITCLILAMPWLFIINLY